MVQFNSLSYPCEFSIFLPNGCVQQLEVDKSLTLYNLKEKILKNQNNFLHSLIDWREQYVFTGITTSVDEEIFLDLKSTVPELGIVFPILRLIEYESTLDKNFRENLFCCIGLDSDHFDKTIEVCDEFRWAYSQYSVIANQNHSNLVHDMFNASKYLNEEPRYDNNSVLMKRRKNFKIVSYIQNAEGESIRILLELPIDVTLIDTIRAIKAEKYKIDQVEDHRNFILKCCCSNSYLFDYTSKLIDYLYIQKCLEDGQQPQLNLMTLDEIVRYTSMSAQEWINFHSIPINSIDSENLDNNFLNLMDFNEHFSIYLKNSVILTNPGFNSNVKISESTTPMNVDHFLRQRYADTGKHNSISHLSNFHSFEESPQIMTKNLANSSGRLNNDSSSFYSVRVGLFNGCQSFIESKSSSLISTSSPPVFNESLNFSITYDHLPRATRVNFVLLKIDRRSGNDIEYPIGWVNVNLFNYLGFLIDGTMTLPLWDYVHNTEIKFLGMNSSGTTELNPNPRYALNVTFRGLVNGFRVKFPKKNELLSSAGKTIEFSKNSLTSKSLISELKDIHNKRFNVKNPQIVKLDFDDSVNSKRSKVNEDVSKKIAKILKKDPLSRLSNEEKHLLWNNMQYCREKYPNSLPQLVDSVTWHDRTKVAAFYRILNEWNDSLPVETSLQLLGSIGLSSDSPEQSSSRFYSTSSFDSEEVLGTFTQNSSGGNLGLGGAADPWIREIAILSLDEKLKNLELANYLLQLVQILKVEPYYFSPLGLFLLKRCLASPRLLGIPFFWHLRAEMNDPKLCLKFGILLEAFCRGCGPLFHVIVNQVNSLRTLETISTRIKQFSSEEEQLNKFKELINLDSNKNLIQNFFNPLAVQQKFGNLDISSCKIMHSKKKPLWLVWNNLDHYNIYHYKKYQIIYKHGDDLRQDMLTLQILKVMDNLWKTAGFDFCLSVYSCLSTGNQTGLIEAVRNARTIMSIQNESVKAAMQLDSSRLHRWIETQTQSDPILYERAIHNFTYSCAGYCVATFILGIRDRHNDNIMTDQMGHLFHIDFGHFLDNRKKKFGINRERVPFVLPEDFVVVICKGREKANRGEEFNKFVNLCMDAYKVLRKNANLIITLLSMMLLAQLPELYAVQHLNHVRNTLAVDKTDKEAEEYFRTTLKEAYSGGWTTKVDWFGHWMNS